MRSRVPRLDVLRPLMYQQTIDRALVHAQHVRHVLLTDINVLGPSAVEIAAQWPQRHDWCERVLAEGICVELMAETFRQAWILTAHVLLESPLANRVTMEELSISRYSAQPIAHPEPARIALVMTITTVARTSAGTVREFTAEADFYLQGRHIGHGKGRGVLLDPQIYARLRGDRPARYPTLTPHSVKLVHSDQGNGMLLSADVVHQRYFDHPQDHVPGMVLIAAAFDAAEGEGRGGLACMGRGFTARFNGFLENDERVEITMHPAGGRIAVGFRQLGTTRALVTVEE